MLRRNILLSISLLFLIFSFKAEFTAFVKGNVSQKDSFQALTFHHLMVKGKVVLEEVFTNPIPNR